MRFLDALLAVLEEDRREQGLAALSHVLEVLVSPRRIELAWQEMTSFMPSSQKGLRRADICSERALGSEIRKSSSRFAYSISVSRDTT